MWRNHNLELLTNTNRINVDRSTFHKTEIKKISVNRKRFLMIAGDQVSFWKDLKFHS